MSKIINYKTGFFLSLLTLVLLIGYFNKNTIKKETIKTSKEVSFDRISVFITPRVDTISIEQDYEAAIGISASRLTTKPIIVIASEIDDHFNLIGKIDTFNTDNWISIIKIKPVKKGDINYYGKYIFNSKGLNLPKELTFSYSFYVE